MQKVLSMNARPDRTAAPVSYREILRRQALAGCPPRPAEWVRAHISPRGGSVVPAQRIRMRPLDQRLYAWLAEPDERRFERAFNAYFGVAFPAVTRHLARLSRWDSSHLEDLAQEALLKFFERVGRGRREASDLIQLTLPRLHPLALGPFHERQMKGWKDEISSFRDSAMGFRVTPRDEADDATWKSTIRALTDRVPGLQRQGGHLVQSVQVKLGWDTGDVTSAEALPVDSENVSSFILSICEQLAEENDRSLAARAQLPGVQRFCEGTRAVVVALPPLRVPTNSFLFEIALSLYLDECKRRGRRKRGGTGVSSAGRAEARGESAMGHPVDSMTPETDSTDERDGYAEGAETASLAGSQSSASFIPSHDPTPGYENEDFLERFCQYLREPLDRATALYEAAESPGRAVAERRKVESLTHKFSRTMAVLTHMGEGYTQEQTAKRLGVSRNQVKYIIELVQEAYLRFAETPIRSSEPASAPGGGVSTAPGVPSARPSSRWSSTCSDCRRRPPMGCTTSSSSSGSYTTYAIRCWRSSTSRASSNPYFCMPTRSAWPGRGRRRGFCVRPGAGDISSAHFGHSVLRIMIATGDPSVRPWRTPPRNSSSSSSRRMRGPRPNPRRRRASSVAMSSMATGKPAGSPSTTATRAGPCDSPAVKKRSTWTLVPGMR